MNNIYPNLKPLKTIVTLFCAFVSIQLASAQNCPGLGSLTLNVLPPPIPTIQAPAKICTGSPATLTVNETFTSYEWNNGATTQSLNINAPGTYSVTVYNAAGCPGSGTVSVQAEQGPTPGIATSTDTCLGQVSLTAGTGFTAYLWSTGSTSQNITVNTANSYTVTVTNAAGCKGTASITPNLPAQAQIQISGDTVLCFGDTLQLIATLSGASAYQWSNGFSADTIQVDSAGTFTVTALNQYGCLTTDSLKITASQPVQPAIAGPVSYCDSISAQLEVINSLGIFVWNTGDSTAVIPIDSAGFYAVTVTNTLGCTGTAIHQLTGSTSPTPLLQTAPYACDGAITLQADAGFSAYQWSVPGTDASLQVNASGNYSVTVTNAAGCSGSTSLLVDIPALPSVVISGQDSICQGGNTLLSVPSGFVQYDWSDGTHTTSIQANIAGIYSVTVTDALGCTATHALPVTELSLPNPQISGPSQICPAGLATFTVPGSFATYAWSTGETTTSISTNTAGNYTVIVSSAFGCTASASQMLTITNNLQPQILSLPYACDGQITLDAGSGFALYTWSNGVTSQVLQAGASGMYEVTVNDGAGCTGSATIQVNIPTPPTVTLQGDMALCNGLTGQLSVAQTYPQYLWSSGQNTPTINVAAGQTYTLTITDANGCTSSGSASIGLLPGPVAGITIQPYACNQTLVLDAGSGFTQYQWAGPNGFTAVNPQIDASNNGTYTVTITDATGCTGTTTAQVNIPVQNAVTLSGQQQFCSGNTVQLNAATGFAQYQWSNGSSQQQISSGTAGTFTVTATDAQGCTSTASITLSQLPDPVPVITGPAQVCPGATATLSVNAPFSSYQWSTGSTVAGMQATAPFSASVTVTDQQGCTGTAVATVGLFNPPVPAITTLPYQCNQSIGLSADPAAQYAWQGPNGFSNQTANPIVNTSGIYWLTVTDANTCTGTASVQVSIPAPPLVNINGISGLCSGQSGALNATTGFGAYLWSNGATDASISVTQSGNYTVTVSDALGCTASAGAPVTLFPAPAPSITPQPYQCNQQVDLMADGGFAQYLWNNGSTTTGLTVTQSGQYALTVTNQEGCTGTTTWQAQIPPVPTVQVNGPTSLCIGDQTLLSASGNTTGFIWSDGSGNASLLITQAGAYAVTATDALGCTATASLVVMPAFPVAVTLETTTCRESDAGTSVVTLTSINGCDSVLTTISTYSPVRPDYALDMETLIDAHIGEAVLIAINSNFSMDSVVLHSSLTLSCFDCANPEFTALESGFIQVEAFDPDGCYTTGEIRVQVEKSIRLYVPNVFQPGSELNGFFDLFSGPEISSVRNFQVYDRWGNMLFWREDLPTNAPGSGWDGSFRGQPMQPGVYVYHFEVLLADGSVEKYSGDVTVIR